MAKLTGGDWNVEEIKVDGVTYFMVVDEANRTIVDTCNSEVAEIHEEADEDGVCRWDEQGSVNCAAISALPQLLDLARAVIEHGDGPLRQAARRALSKAECEFTQEQIDRMKPGPGRDN